MSLYKVTIGFTTANIGASESYISADLSQSQLGPAVQTLLNTRNDMLFVATTWVGVRISAIDFSSGLPVTARRGRFLIPGAYSVAKDGIDLLLPSNGARLSLSTDEGSDQGRSTLLCRLTYDTDKNTIRYLAFVPDKVVGHEPASVMFQNDAIFTAAFGKWQTLMTSKNWSIAARRSDTGYVPIPIMNFVQNAPLPSVIGAVIPVAADTKFNVGDKVAVKGVRRKGPDQTSYNGIYRVDSVLSVTGATTQTVFLRGSELAIAASIKNTGTIQKVGYKDFTIANYNTARAGTHKRGGPFVKPRGRTLKRKSILS